MKNLLHKTGIILMATLLIAATGGISIYHHICHCAGESSASIFMEADCDHGAGHSSVSCCNTTASHSCCMESLSKESKPACHTGNCCETSSQFLKISDSFQPGMEKVTLKPLWNSAALLPVFIEDTYQTDIFPTRFNADMPPPDTGRQILVALHQLKLDPVLV